MRTLQNPLHISLMGGAAILLCCFLVSPSLSEDQHEYNPAFQRVVYRVRIPAAIEHVTKKVGPTRFFGTFQQGGHRFALHFYDTSRVRPHNGAFERNSRLDIFQLVVNKTWHRMQTFASTRQIGERRDALSVETQTLWLGPTQKTIPLIYLHTSEGYGNETAIYGVLQSRPNPKAFLSLDGYNPESNTTVISSQIS